MANLGGPLNNGRSREGRQTASGGFRGALGAITPLPASNSPKAPDSRQSATCIRAIRHCASVHTLGTLLPPPRNYLTVLSHNSSHSIFFSGSMTRQNDIAISLIDMDMGNSRPSLRAESPAMCAHKTHQPYRPSPLLRHPVSEGGPADNKAA